MNVQVKMVLTVLAICFISGCSMFQPDKQALKISCNIPDTILKVDGDQHKCPAEMNVRRDKKFKLKPIKLDTIDI